MKATPFLLALGLGLITGCNEGTPPPGETAEPAPPPPRTSETPKPSAKTVDLAGLNKAVEAFYVTEGRFPKTLDELVDQGLIRIVPEPPPGSKLVYDATNGVITLQRE